MEIQRETGLIGIVISFALTPITRPHSLVLEAEGYLRTVRRHSIPISVDVHGPVGTVFSRQFWHAGFFEFLLMGVKEYKGIDTNIYENVGTSNLGLSTNT